MRAIWKGHISFGLVSVPVSLYAATGGQKLSFNMLHKKDNSPVKYKKFCAKEDKEVPREEIVKGYEIEKEQYVVLTEEDFEKVGVEKTRSISIINFVHSDEINPMWMDRPYYLEVREGGETAYELLRRALQETSFVGICKVVLRNKEHLACLMPQEKVLVLELMRFANEMRSAAKLDTTENVKVEGKQLDLAKELINKISGDFHYEDYVDEYSEQLKDIIKQKAEGKEVVAPTPRKAPEVKSLMDALEKSLKAA